MTRILHHNFNSHAYPPPRLLPLLEKLKNVYLLWYAYFKILPKPHRYTIGQRVDNLFIEAIEVVATAAFLKPEEKLPFVRHAIRKIDTLKILLMLLWETKSLNDKRYIALSEKIDEIGRNLGGWHGQIVKQNPVR